MTLHRFVLWFVDGGPFLLADAKDLASAFFTGARFDVLVLGFVLIPVVLAGSVVVLANFAVERAMSFFLRFLAGVWAVVCGLAAADLLFFCESGRRMTLIDLRQGADFFSAVSEKQGLGTVTLVIAIFVCTWILGAREILSARIARRDEHAMDPAWKTWGRIVIPLLIVGLMARGTVTAHHLERAHSEVSVIPAVNELALNAVWCFDKEPVNR